jgi:hypothetical protein
MFGSGVAGKGDIWVVERRVSLGTEGCPILVACFSDMGGTPRFSSCS